MILRLLRLSMSSKAGLAPKRVGGSYPLEAHVPCCLSNISTFLEAHSSPGAASKVL